MRHCYYHNGWLCAGNWWHVRICTFICTTWNSDTYSMLRHVMFKMSRIMGSQYELGSHQGHSCIFTSILFLTPQSYYYQSDSSLTSPACNLDKLNAHLICRWSCEIGNVCSYFEEFMTNMDIYCMKIQVASVTSISVPLICHAYLIWNNLSQIPTMNWIQKVCHGNSLWHFVHVISSQNGPTAATTDTKTGLWGGGESL